MDKGRSKTDLRAAGKKRLEEFRQKRQQKGGSTKSPATGALKALTESEQGSGELVIEGALTSDLPSEEPQNVLPENSNVAEIDSGSQSVADKSNKILLDQEEEPEGVKGLESLDPSPSSPIRRLRLDGHLALETSEQSDSPCDPGSSNGNLEDAQREAVYTILWENHEPNHNQPNEEWQESTYEGGEKFDDEALDQGNYSTFRVDDEHYGNESREGSSIHRKLNGVEKSAEDFREFVETSMQEAPAQDVLSMQTMSTHELADEVRGDGLPDQADVEVQPSIEETSGEKTPEGRILSEGVESTERDTSHLEAAIAVLEERLDSILKETGREREILLNEIGSLKGHIKDCAVEKDELLRIHNSHIQELEGATLQLRQELQSTLENADREKQQFLTEREDLKAEVGRISVERDEFLCDVKGHENEMETLKAEATRLMNEMKFMVEEKAQVVEDLLIAREQAHGAIEREALLMSELSRIKEEREEEIFRVGELQERLHDMIEENMKLEVRCKELADSLRDLGVVNQKLVDDVAESEQQRQRLETEMAIERESSRNQVVTMEDEQLKFHALVENLTHRLQTYEEEHKNHEALDAQVKVYEAESWRLESEVDKLSISLQSAEEEKEKLASELNSLQAENTGLVTEVRDAKNEIKVMAEEVLTLNGSVHSRQEQNVIIVKEKDDLSLQLQNLEREKMDLVSKVGALSALEQELRGEIARQVNEAGELKSERDLREKEFTERVETLDSHVRSLEHKIQILMTEKDDVEQQLCCIGAEGAGFATKLSELEVERDNLCQKLEMVSTLNVNLETEKRTYTSQLGSLKEQLQLLEEEKEKLRNLHERSFQLVKDSLPVSFKSQVLGSTEVQEDLSSALGLFQQHLCDVSGERDQLVCRIDAVGEHLKELENEKEQLNHKVFDLEEHFMKATADGFEAAKQLENWKHEATRLAEEKEEVVKQLVVVECQLKSESMEQSGIAADLQRLKLELTRLEGENEVAKSRMDESRQELQQVNDELIFFKGERAEMETSFGMKLKALEENGSVLLEEKVGLCEELAGAREELEQLREELRRVHNEKVEAEKSSAAAMERLEQQGALALDETRLELTRDVAELQEALKERADEILILRLEMDTLHGNWKQRESENTAAVMELQRKLLCMDELANENRRLDGELKEREQQRTEQQVQTNFDVLKEAESPTLEQGSQDVDSKEVLDLLKCLRVGKANEDVVCRSSCGDRFLVTKVFIQGEAMKNSTDVLQEDRDIAVQAELARRADRESMSKELSDAIEGRITLQALVEDLEENLATMREADEERVKMITSLQEEQSVLKAHSSELAGGLVAANAEIQAMVSEGRELQRHSKELELCLQREKAKLETLLGRLVLLVNCIKENLSKDFPEVVGDCNPACDLISQVENGLGLLVKTVLPELIAKVKGLEEERDFANTAAHDETGKNRRLQVEMDELLLEREALKAEMERVVTNEEEARAGYERDIDTLTLKLQELEKELLKVKNNHQDFEKKLELAVSVNDVVTAPGVEDGSFEFCWTLIELMLKKLQNVEMEMAHTANELNEVLREERSHHQANIGALEAQGAGLRQEVEDLFMKVRLLEDEKGLLQDECDSTAKKLQMLQEEKSLHENVVVNYQSQIDELNLKLHNLQREDKERITKEEEFRAGYEQEIESLNLKVHEAQTEVDKLDKLNEAIVLFEQKLENVVHENFPEVVVKPLGTVESPFDLSWSIIGLILEESSRKLQHSDMQLVEMQKKMVSSGKEKEVETLQEQLQSIMLELSKANEEKSTAQSELLQTEKRLANTKERLSLAISKGKSVVQQRDAVKQGLAEKTGELERVISTHTEMMKLKDIALKEAEAKVFSLKEMTERASLLEADLAAAQNMTSSLERSLLETKSFLSELEGAVDSISLVPHEKPKKGLAKLMWLEEKLTELQMRVIYFERKAEDLILDMTTMSSERETVVNKLRDVVVTCDQLEKKAAEDVSVIAALESEIKLLQASNLAMKDEILEYVKLQQDVKSAMMLLDSLKEVQQDSGMTSGVAKPSTEWGVELAIALLIEKYTSAVHEAKELANALALTTEETERLEREKTSIISESMQSLQKTLQSHDIELTQIKERMEAAATTLSEQDSEIQALVQEAESLREELIKSREEVQILRLELNMTQEIVAALRDHLLLVITSDSDGVAGDGNTETGRHATPLSTLKDLEFLAIRIVEQSQQKEIELQNMQMKSIDMEEATSTLELELETAKKEREALAEELQRRELEAQAVLKRLVVMEEELDCARNLKDILERSISDFKAVAEGADLPIGPSLTSPAEWLSYLLQALHEEQSNSRQAAQEVAHLKKAADAVSLEVGGVQGEYDSLHEELVKQKIENEDLVDRLNELAEDYNSVREQAARGAGERDSLKAEIQALEKSHLELTSRDVEFSEASRAVKSLEEMLTSKDKELYELQKEMERTSLEYAQRNVKFQALVDENQQLGGKLMVAEGERDRLRVEVTDAENLKSALQSEVSRAEQKLAVAREKLNLAIKKGKGLEKQRDSLKQSISEVTGKMESAHLTHTQVLQSKESEMHLLKDHIAAMANRIATLESELVSVREKASAYEQRVEKEFQGLDSTLSQVEFPKEMVSTKLIEKIEWLAIVFKETRNTVVFLEKELDSNRDTVDFLKTGLRDAEERVQSLMFEDSKAQKTVSLWMKKVEEAENRGISDRAQYENEIDLHTQSVKEAELRLRALSTQVRELEQALEKSQNALNASEAARSKAASKSAYTRNKLNELLQQSQELVGECETLQKTLQDRNTEIADLKARITSLSNESHLLKRNQVPDVDTEADTQIAFLKGELEKVRDNADADSREFREHQEALQNALKVKSSELGQIQKQLEEMLGKGDNTAWMERNIVNISHIADTFEEVDIHHTNGKGDWIATVGAVQQKVDKLVAEAQAWKINADKKDSQLQKLKKEMHELVTEKEMLQAGLLTKNLQMERLQSELNSAAVSVGDNSVLQSEIEEVGSRGNWVVPGSSAAPHVRGTRRPVQAEVTIDVDEEATSLLSDMDDKGHGLSALTNSRLVPKATRVLADRFDGLCVAGGRLLMRQPTARLGLATYWILIHVYMAMIFSRVLIL